MKSKSDPKLEHEIPTEVDFSGGVRGKYAVRFPQGSLAIVLDSDVAEVFPTAEAANDALRDLAGIIKRADKPANPAKRSSVSRKKPEHHAETGK